MLSHIINFSVHHRWFVLLLTLAAGIIGAVALVRLPIDAVPDISNKIVQITTLYPSLSPAEVEKQITFPIETALAGIPSLSSTRSLTRNGFAQVEAVFHDGTDIYFARQQVLERLTEVRESLPPGAEPAMGPVTTGLGEIYVYIVEYEHPRGAGAPVADGQSGWQSNGGYLTPEGSLLRSDIELSAYLRTVQDWIITPQLRTVPGVAGVDTIGGHEKNYLVQPDLAKLLSYGLAIDDLITALELNNASAGAGFIELKGEAHVIRADGRVKTMDDIASIVIGARNGTPIYIRDVARVSHGRELRTGAASENGEEVVIGTALMLLGGNSRTVSTAVADKVEEIKLSLPAGVQIRPVLVRTELVDKTIATVKENLFLGAVLVIVILFALLGNIRAAIISALAIPLAMLFTAIGMDRLGISGNLMSLGAIDFGLVVDGAVIIVENCLRHIASRRQALGRALTRSERLDTVIAASKEVRSATAFGEAIIIVVYIPILALTGVEGKMFHPMALTVICALAAAFILTLTFVPAMTAILMTSRVSDADTRLVRVMKRLYQPVLTFALRRRWLVLTFASALFAAAIGLFASLGQEFVPQLDEGNIALQSLRIPSTSLTVSQAMQFEVEKAVRALPEVELMYSKTGTAEVAFDPMPPNISDGYIILKPRNQWPNPKLTKPELIEKIRAAVAPLPGHLFEFSQPIELRINELVAGARGDLAVKVFGDGFDEIRTTAQQVLQILQTVPGAADVKMAQIDGFPAVEIELDRAALARHGVNVADVQDTISAAVGGQQAGIVYEGDRQFDIIVRLADAVRDDLRAIEQIPIALPNSAELTFHEGSAGHGSASSIVPRGMIPLSAIARIKVTEGLGQINRENGKRRMTVQANVRGRDLGSFVAEARSRIMGEIKPAAGTWLAWGGQYENLLAARQRLQIVVPICLLLIFLLLFATFNSVKYALLVFSGVPFAVTGGVAALWLRGIPFSISAAVGFIALSGMAVLNGLVMITHINQVRRESGDTLGAVMDGSLTRLRPVMTTALVAALGFVPMALATGTGAEVQRPLATVVIGGILTSTLLTLIVLPALYRAVHRR